MAVGDIMLGDSTLCIGHGVGAKIKARGVTFPFLHVADVLRKGDIVFGNLEAVLSNNGMDKKYLNSVAMRAMPEAVAGLNYAGFSVLSLANNHILEHGSHSLLETAQVLAQHNIKYSGVDTPSSKARRPLMVNAKGIKIAFLSYCLVPDKTAYISINGHDEICHDVRKAKSQADIVVVSLHWGSEYIERPAPWQVNLAHHIIDSGANVISGHHPHVLQGIESYNRGVIAYSLGNFVFDMNYIEETIYSVILECKLSKKGVDDFKLYPIIIGADYAPQPLLGGEGERLLTRLNRLSSELKAESSLNHMIAGEEYSKQAESSRRQARKKMWRYFANKIYKYPYRYAFQIVENSLRKYLS